MTAKKDGHCAECDDDIITGQRMVWDPIKFDAFCGPCSPIGDEDEGSAEHARKKQSEYKNRSKAASKKKEKGRS